MEIPGYKLVRAVEAGQVCTIYHALDIQHSKTVIVKIFNHALSKNLAFQNHFKEVTEHLINKNLGNNVHFLDAIVNENACIIITKYYPGSIQQEGNLPEYTEDKVIAIAAQLAASLSQLHKLGIVHGGVELSNIYFLDSGEVILGPIAPQRTIPDPNTLNFSLLNIKDATCLAPEANSGLTASSDFFSLGVVLYELLTGRKPFQAGSMAELELQKKDGKHLPLRSELTHLNPLFNGLFSPNSESRIASDDQFHAILNACLMCTTGGSHSVAQKLTGIELTGVTSLAKTIASGKKTEGRSLLLATIATVVIGVVAVTFMFSGKEENLQQASDEKQTAVVAKKSDPITEIPSMIQQPKEQTETNGFYANARALAEQGDYDAALQAIDRALSIETDKVPVEKLKNEIERELKIRSFLVAAEQQLKDKKLILPPGDNAFETYQRVSHLAAQGDERAASGIQKIADYYLELANDLASNNNLDEAKKAISQGLTVRADYAPLLELKSSLAVKNEILDGSNSLTQSEQPQLAKAKLQPVVTEQAEKIRQAKSSSNKEIFSRETLSKPEGTIPLIQQKQHEREEKTKALKVKQGAEQYPAVELAEQQRLEDKRTAQIKKAKRQAAQQRMLVAREAEIVRRLKSAEQQLTIKLVSRLALDTAEREYWTLTEITDNDSRVTRLYRKIVDSHITLANRQQNAAQLSESMETVTRGLALDIDNIKLLALKNRIADAIKESENKQNEVPVIGTF